MHIRNDTRTDEPIPKTRKQVSWFVECVRVGIPVADLPPRPPAHATHREKVQWTVSLRKLYTQRTGKLIERVTPLDHNKNRSKYPRYEDAAARFADWNNLDR